MMQEVVVVLLVSTYLLLVLSNAACKYTIEYRTVSLTSVGRRE
jgi:hypothetical protein